jgi:predicted TIM-barrel fold metal-dependent hydrolase
MIIDAHAHLDEVEAFGWKDTPEKLLGLMDAAGIDKAVVTTYADEPGPEDGLDRLTEYVQAHPDRFIGFPRMDPRYGDVARRRFRRAVTEEGMRGLKLHPVSNLSNPFADFTVELMDLAAELVVPVLYHSGDRVMCLPRQLAEAANRTEATFILGHMGGFFNAFDIVDVAERHENIVLETSAFPYPRLIQEAVDRLGADRVLYGSDQPAANPHVELEKIRVLDLTDEERERLLFRNIADLVGLDVGGAT